eukprot:PhF_6_TR42842/c1_g1_i1/m.64878
MEQNESSSSRTIHILNVPSVQKSYVEVIVKAFGELTSLNHAFDSNTKEYVWSAQYKKSADAITAAKELHGKEIFKKILRVETEAVKLEPLPDVSNPELTGLPAAPAITAVVPPLLRRLATFAPVEVIGLSKIDEALLPYLDPATREKILQNEMKIKELVEKRDALPGDRNMILGNCVVFRDVNRDVPASAILGALQDVTKSPVEMIHAENPRTGTPSRSVIVDVGDNKLTKFLVDELKCLTIPNPYVVLPIAFCLDDDRAVKSTSEPPKSFLQVPPKQKKKRPKSRRRSRSRSRSRSHKRK